VKIRNELAPYLAGYEEKFTSKGEIRWLPHLLFFHPPSHRSDVVNTDSIGFRYATDGGRSYSVADQQDAGSVRLLAGSSTVFGIGASSDAWTLPSRLNVHDDRPGTWLNFGGRSFNSTQELLLLTLYRHLLPNVDEIVLFSGFNNLSLARMPQMREEDHGTFFQYTMYQDIFAQHAKTKSPMRGLLRREKETPAPAAPSIDEQIAYAADLTLRHLSGWKALASTWDAKITYILQPLSGWVRDKGSREEELIFDELEQHGGFAAMYGDILSREVNIEYAAMLEQGAKEMGIDFVNFSPVLAGSAQQDHGHDFVASKILENI
jgi:hypothetical protein